MTRLRGCTWWGLVASLSCLAAVVSGQALPGLLLPAAQPAGTGTCRMEPGAAHSFCGLPYALGNFQGAFRCERDVIVGRPADYRELARLVQVLLSAALATTHCNRGDPIIAPGVGPSKQAYSKVKAVGVGHSWWKEQFCASNSSEGINIVTTELPERKASITVNEAELTATVPAGVTQRGLLQFLDAYRTGAAPDGYTLPAFSWFIDQTMGGAVATATHGSSLVFGSLSSQLKGLKVMLANGSIADFTSGSSPHLWHAATTSVGRLGIMLELTISIVKNTRVRRAKTDVAVPAFVDDIKQLSQRYTSAAANGPLSLQVCNAIKDWDETQWFWFIPSRKLWRASFKRQTPLSGDSVGEVLASDGPEGRQELLPGAFKQQSVQQVTAGPGIERNARWWSDSYQAFLSQNVAPGVLPAREAYLSATEAEARLGSTWAQYVQYEVAIPLSRAGACMAALADELYGPKARWSGFRSPALIRLIRAEHAYLSPAHGEPVLYINLEDYVSAATNAPNGDFQAVLALLRSPVCRGRLHWGKGGWQEEYGRCFDGAQEYLRSWCHFGCAVAQLDPRAKFAGQAGGTVWRWRASDKATGQQVADFASCCGPSGFDEGRCSCASVGAGCWA